MNRTLVKILLYVVLQTTAIPLGESDINLEHPTRIELVSVIYEITVISTIRREHLITIGFEPISAVYLSAVLPLNYITKMVRKLGVEPKQLLS